MSWITLIWSMMASACLTLTVIYLFVWWKNRSARAPLLFSVAALSTTAFAFCELWMMRSATREELLLAVTWSHVPLFFLLVSITWLGYELSRDVLRASQLVRELQASNHQISDLCGRLISAQETERTRVARDLHDDISQRIATMSIKMSIIKRQVHRPPTDTEVEDALTSLQQDTYALAEEIRRLSHDLHPSQLQHTGFMAALGAFCAEFERLHAIEVVCDTTSDVDVDIATGLCLYRIAQEALHNVAKHATARHAAVALTREADGVHLTIIDDGIGFDLATSRGKNLGLGLVSIDERVRLLRGSVHIDTRPGHGTRLEVHIPPSGNSTPATAVATTPALVR